MLKYNTVTFFLLATQVFASQVSLDSDADAFIDRTESRPSNITSWDLWGPDLGLVEMVEGYPMRNPTLKDLSPYLSKAIKAAYTLGWIKAFNNALLDNPNNADKIKVPITKLLEKELFNRDLENALENALENGDSIIRGFSGSIEHAVSGDQKSGRLISLLFSDVYMPPEIHRNIWKLLVGHKLSYARFTEACKIKSAGVIRNQEIVRLNYIKHMGSIEAESEYVIQEGFVEDYIGEVFYHAESESLIAAFHGSRSGDGLPLSYDWLANLDTDQMCIRLGGVTINAHRGFMMMALFAKDSLASILDRCKHKYHNLKKILFTGHSLGAAISSLLCMITIIKERSVVGNKQFSYGHYGISEPASIASHSIMPVRILCGKNNFLSVGVRQDPIIHILRQGFHRDKGGVLMTKKYRSLTLAIAFGSIATDKNLFKKVTSSDYDHTGHLILEDFEYVKQRVKICNKDNGLIDNVKALFYAVHYGGPDGKFDPKLVPACWVFRQKPVLSLEYGEEFTVETYLDFLKNEFTISLPVQILDTVSKNVIDLVRSFKKR